MPTAFYVSYAALWLLVITVAVLTLLLYRHFGLAALDTATGHAEDGIPVGTRALDVEGVGVNALPVAWRAGEDHPALILFASPECAPCAEIMPHLSRLAEVSRGELSVVAVSSGGADGARHLQELGPSVRCIGQDGSASARDYKVVVSPFAFIADGEGRIRAKGLASQPRHLRQMLEQANMEHAARLLGGGTPAGPAAVADHTEEVIRERDNAV